MDQQTPAPGLVAFARHEKHLYAGAEERPLGSFAALMSGYGGLVAALSAVVVARRRELPERLSAGDLALTTIATHKLARLIAKDPVTSPLRAPFTTFSGTSGEAELAEEVRGTGMRKAIGELITCPFCLAQWVATSLVFGLVIAPRPTRVAASVFVAVAGADALQLLYAKAQAWAT